MKLLLDSCMSAATRPALEAAGHDVICAAEWPSDPGDDEILMRAAAEGRVLITLDRDFGELAVAGRARHAGILRIVKMPFREHARAILQVIDAHSAALVAGAIITASAGRLRIRSPE
jgi:predicted nuclease of predicted toxin-antitoxin system